MTEEFPPSTNVSGDAETQALTAAMMMRRPEDTRGPRSPHRGQGEAEADTPLTSTKWIDKRIMIHFENKPPLNVTFASTYIFLCCFIIDESSVVDDIKIKSQSIPEPP